MMICMALLVFLQFNNYFRHIDSLINVGTFVMHASLAGPALWTFSAYGPTVGALIAESPKDFLQKKTKCNLVAKRAFWARICTISCMRKVTYISDGFRMRAGPPSP